MASVAHRAMHATPARGEITLQYKEQIISYLHRQATGNSCMGNHGSCHTCMHWSEARRANRLHYTAALFRFHDVRGFLLSCLS